MKSLLAVLSVMPEDPADALVADSLSVRRGAQDGVTVREGVPAHLLLNPSDLLHALTDSVLETVVGVVGVVLQLSSDDVVVVVVVVRPDMGPDVGPNVRSDVVVVVVVVVVVEHVVL